jgi:hypothetical protein
VSLNKHQINIINVSHLFTWSYIISIWRETERNTNRFVSVSLASLMMTGYICEDAGVFSDSPPLELLSQPSSAEYLICTRISSSSPLAPILGLAVTSFPSVLITLLSSGEVVSLNLVPVPLPQLLSTRALNGNQVTNSCLKVVSSAMISVKIQLLKK